MPGEETANKTLLRLCTVSFTDSAGVRHSAEVTAESLFEAAVLGLRAISQEWAEEPGLLTPVDVQVKAPAITHQVTLKQLRSWIGSTARSPRERLIKERLRPLLGG